MFAVQHMAATGCDQMQLVALVGQQFVNAATIKGLQAGGKFAADLFGTGPFLAGRQFVVLGDVVALQPLKRRHRLMEASRGHAPGTNGRAHQMHRLAGLRQPLAKDKTVQRPQDQALGATGCTGNHANVFGPQAVFADMREGLEAGVNVQRPHGLTF
jgi:hypothetical protein